MTDYLKFWLIPNGIVAVAIAGLLLGGHWVWLGIATFPILAITDRFIPRNMRPRRMNNSFLSTAPVWTVCIGSLVIYFFTALIPPLWHEVIIKPALKRWDIEYATEEEQKLAREANRAAGWEDWLADDDPATRTTRFTTVGC